MAVAQNQKANYSIFLPLICAMGLMIGLVLTLAGSQELVRATSSTSWPTTEGLIEETKIYHGSKGSTSPSVHYRFMVNGKPYKGNCIGYAGPNGDPTCQSAQSAIEKYSIGTPVTVHFCPDDPSVNVLVPGASKYTWGTLKVGLVLCTMGLAAFARLLQLSKKTAQP